ncbi:MAG: OmpA family protein [Acidobacteria bacterium]|jgi:outer membrane protein OmpA-like peptidoglycan-associated protein|nr:OmpA family protein [Acidobacteriota bacterium]
MKNRHLVILAGLVLVAALVTGPACATKKFVRTESATLDQKIAEVSSDVEASQKRIKEHDDQLSTIGSLITQHDGQFKAVDGKIEEVKTLIKGNLVLTATVKNSDAKFGFDSAALAPEAKSVLDAFVQRLVTENKGVYIEIQGHTDSTGSDDINLALGQKRADAVRMYLYKQHHIPLHRMSAVSMGSSMPIADNGTRDGRSANRRVEILVYE